MVVFVTEVVVEVVVVSVVVVKVVVVFVVGRGVVVEVDVFVACGNMQPCTKPQNPNP